MADAAWDAGMFFWRIHLDKYALISELASGWKGGCNLVFRYLSDPPPYSTVNISKCWSRWPYFGFLCLLTKIHSQDNQFRDAARKKVE